MARTIAMSGFFVLAIACTVIFPEKLMGGPKDSIALQPSAASSTKPWKYDIDILEPPIPSTRAIPTNTAGPYCDEDGRIWVPLEVSFGPRSDAYVPHLAYHIMCSKDKGLTWEFMDLKYPQDWPGPRTDTVTLADGTIIEARSGGFERHPRSQIERLQKEGYNVWDLGEKEGFCAIAHMMWIRRSTDGGKTWEEKPLHKQFPFFARLFSRRLLLLDDGTILNFCYGQKTPTGRNSVYVARSSDGGNTWELVLAADGQDSPIGPSKAHNDMAGGFNETFPVVQGKGRILVMMRTRLGKSAFVVRSLNGGKSWSKPERTPITAKHPNVTRLTDGTILCTYQRRFAPPFGVRARFTSDLGKTWSEEVVIRDDIINTNGLYEPRTVELPDGTLFTLAGAMKNIDGRGICSFLAGARWTRNYRRPMVIKLPVPPLTPKLDKERIGKSPWQK